MDLNNESSGKLENLEQKINNLLGESKDKFFTQYLLELQRRVVLQKSQIDMLQNEFDRNYAIYVKRMQSEEETASKADSVPGEAESVKEIRQEVTYATYVSSNVPAADNVFMPQNDQTHQYTVPWVEADNSYKWSNTYQKKKSDTEFVVGASILGVIGGIFILIALVLFGMNYMTGFVKGMCLYASCIAVLIISEALVYKRVRKLGSILSSLAFGGLYLSTAVNFISLNNFGMWPALVLTVVISALVLFLGRRRNSSIYKVLGILAGYACFLMIEEGIGTTEFLTVSLMLLMLNLVYAFVQVKGKQAVTDTIHMISTALFSLCYAIRAGYCHVDAGIIMIYLVCSTIVIHFIFIMRIRNHRAEAESLAQKGLISGSNAGIITAYVISTIFYSIIINLVISGMDSFIYVNSYLPMINQGRLITASAVCAVGLIAFIVLSAMKAPEKWYIYCYINFMAFTMYFFDMFGISFLYEGRGIELAACSVILLVISKLLSFRGNIYVKVCDAILTFFTCLLLMASSGTDSYILLGGVLFGILCISKWRTYNEVILITALTAYTALHMPAMLRLPAIVGILFVGMLLFNHFDRLHDRYIIVFNAFALGVQTACYMFLMNPVYRNAYITYLCMLVFGAATIVLIFQKRYNMDFKLKNLVLAIFLTYMGFIFKSSEPILNSIILMVVALVCVGTGFANGQKFLRIYGLVLALMICGKMVLYDFMDAATLQKIILFFAVGVIALIIAGIYIILEKKSSASKQ